MSDPGIDLGQGVQLDRGAVEWRFSASGGPGGQHVNTSNTRAEAVLDLERADLPAWARHRLRRNLGPVVSVTASDTRSQARNRDLALERLVDKLRQALRPPPPPRRPTRPTVAARRKRLSDKRRRGELKDQRRRPPDE
ncbi:MAG TPA: alternative ribosome rescue aminoacyl-tRNA hydrolase ArfB [Acidimicrobiales bacterium]|nr:alternative ribosome rescue aminoacyl-tRNA hydrolase ArfB [Acidimicrobiales bacterium]